MASSAAHTERATHRTVILLRESEKLTLERLARAQKITSAEVLRRLIREGETLFQDQNEKEAIESALRMISAAARDANASMTKTMEKVDKLHEEIMARDIA
jgi:RNA polymerase-interacting CarD/CdnL/TRCF family regulator